MELERFVRAQDRCWPTVLAELRSGRKATHWMWFVFPQIAGLGQSETSRYYALADAEEAQAYLAHPVLGPRLGDARAAAGDQEPWERGAADQGLAQESATEEGEGTARRGPRRPGAGHRGSRPRNRR